MLSGVAYILFLTFSASDEVYYVSRFTGEVVPNVVDCFIAWEIRLKSGGAVQVYVTGGAVWMATWSDGKGCGAFGG